jgi:energy-coupling factor transport system substrate-specific component
MSWQLAAFTLLFLALVGGFAWYERARPDARVVALVAMLAAFAALGRIAFAALPNVKPTTDIVLVSGYALGAGPGFAVGAVAGLTSNFFFGQGPWTPWQMAAWGATGVIGAGLAVLTRHRVRRLPLALACAVVGFAFTVVQDVGDWVTYSDHSVRQLGVYVGKGLGFDAVHSAGCLVFALALGPALARSIMRFARRLDITWEMPSGAVAGALLGLVLAAAGPLAAPSARAATAQASYLMSAQNSDGGLGPAPGQPSQELYAGWAALGLAADGVNPQSVAKAGHSLTDYILAGPGTPSDPGSVERSILALSAAGLDPHRAGGHDLVGQLQGLIRGDGSVSDQVNLTAFAILALRSAGASPAGATVAWLARQQDSDGGFNYGTAGGSSDVDDTGAALEALSGSGDSTAQGRAVGFLRAQQNHDGGFPSSPGQDSNAQSTAWAVQGLLATGVDPGSLHSGGGPSPVQYLQSLIRPDGHIAYSGSEDHTPVWVTAQATMALAGKPLPITPGTRAGGGNATARTGPRRAARRHHAARRVGVATSSRATPGRALADRLAGVAGTFIAVTLAPLGAS